MRLIVPIISGTRNDAFGVFREDSYVFFTKYNVFKGNAKFGVKKQSRSIKNYFFIKAITVSIGTPLFSEICFEVKPFL